MAMAEAFEPVPEREELALGNFNLRFNGISLDGNIDSAVERYVESVIYRINNDFYQATDLDIKFEIDDQIVEISKLRYEFVALEDGSVIAKAKILGAALVTSYGLVASYPSFKEAVPVLRSDLEAAFSYVINMIHLPPSEIPMPKEIELFIRDEDDIVAQIDKMKRR